MLDVWDLSLRYFHWLLHHVNTRDVGELLATSVLLTGLGTSLKAFASETNAPLAVMEKKEDIARKSVSSGSGEVTQSTSNTIYEHQKFEPNGWKKTAMVYALKYGGDYMGSLLKLLNKEAGEYLRKHSFEIGDALDRFTTQIEARLVDFMISQLGFPQWIARNIAWAIMFLIA
ncbi:hypothetical protein J2Z48_000667 [Croceifilum oryzae]|uniref:Uncharacterized protein n=1 Tax=Croceifilum oryzae TaxID=1553429 RepID=A0AAJ1WRE7_9BACL|nr:hypothetical protein [Croceifilum oryzae]MDQ0416500.1 hypothetical protein [Croceifilum oryzae]